MKFLRRTGIRTLLMAGGALALTLGMTSVAQASPSPTTDTQGSGVPGAHVVVGSKTTVGLNSSAKGLAFCPADEVAIGGGVDSGAFQGQYVVTSRPAGSRSDQWLVRMYNDGTSMRFANYFRPYAVCAPSSSVPGYQVKWGNRTTVGLNSSARGLAFCPADEVAIGGGVDSGAFQGQYVVTSRPAGSRSDQWLVRMYNDGTSMRFANYYYPIAICALSSAAQNAG